jgi:hypothetical protein
MTSTVSVGQFATMTHLSVKTLRHYHDVGLLEPARVDADTGYRYYALDQLPTASESTGDAGRIHRVQIHRVQIPAADLVITTHYGSAADIDLAYADLGSYLAEHQIREHYVCDQTHTPDQARWRTEIAWPVLTD